MMQRIFIAIRLPERIKKKLLAFQGKWPELPAKWTKQDNLHVTLAFIGQVQPEELLEICKIAKSVAEKHSPFSIRLNRICYGPIKKTPPRMVWAVGDKSQEFSFLKRDLDKALIRSEGVEALPETRKFSPHITLCRIRQWEWKRIELDEQPQIEEEIDLSFQVDSIVVMESKLKKGGPEYIVLEQRELK